MDKIYQEAARILSTVDQKRGGFRNLVFQSYLKNKKQLYKLCVEVAKKKRILRAIINECNALRDRKIFSRDPFLLHVLVYESLYGIHGLRRCKNKLWLKTMEEFADDLTSAKNRVDVDKVDDGAGEASKKNDELRIPRYARINTLNGDANGIISVLESEGYEMVHLEKTDNKSFVQTVRSLREKKYCIDPIIPNLLIFPAGTDLHAHHLVADGNLILQDKSSCLSALCLDPQPNAHVLDACAAPGMKTSHLAALMENNGRIYASDKNRNRSDTMRTLLEQMGVTCAEVECRDFLRTNKDEKRYKQVTHILLDPPCSGSGIVNRGDDLFDDEDRKFASDEKRINSLGNLQAMMLKFALTFPNVQKVVYSTCSVHERENEMVVQEALEAACGQFELVRVLPLWRHRGLKKYDFGKLCLRANAKKDATNGFFVACFQRRVQ